MGKLEYCPLVGSGGCTKLESEITFKKNTFFLAEPFNPENERQKREKAVRSAIKDNLKDNYSEATLKFADKEPTESAFFCDICKQIQSSEYGIVDLSGLNPNVLLEFGMMLAWGKPVFVIMKKESEEEVKLKLPSDISWKRAITYRETYDIMEGLISQLENRSHLKNQPLVGEISLSLPLETHYGSIKKWYDHIGKKSQPEKAVNQKKNSDKIISQYCQSMKMNPDQIIEDAKREAMSYAGKVKSHDEALKKFLCSLNTDAKAHYYWGVLRGFYKHNDIATTFSRPKYTPIQSYDKLTTEQLRKICDVGTLRSRSWILANSYIGLDVGSLMYLKVEDFHVDKWTETKKIYPVTIREEVSGTFDHITFIGLDAKIMLEEYLKKYGIVGKQDIVWNMHNHQNFITEFARDVKKAGVGTLDAHKTVEDDGLPKNFASITSKALVKRLKDTLEEEILPSNWNLVDYMLGRTREGIEISTPPLFDEIEKAYLKALPKLTVYDGKIPPIVTNYKIIKPKQVSNNKAFNKQSLLFR
jgi:nucleoside 2-deoxyribosyltransferase